MHFPAWWLTVDFHSFLWLELLIDSPQCGSDPGISSEFQVSISSHCLTLPQNILTEGPGNLKVFGKCDFGVPRQEGVLVWRQDQPQLRSSPS